MFCEKCGNKLPDYASFCDKCGNKVASSSSKGSIAHTESISGSMPIFKIVGIILLSIVSIIFLRNMFGGFDSFNDWADTYNAGGFTFLYVLIGLAIPIDLIASAVANKKSRFSLISVSIQFLIIFIIGVIVSKSLENNFMDSENIYLTYRLVMTYMQSIGWSIFLSIVSLGCFLVDMSVYRRY